VEQRKRGNGSGKAPPPAEAKVRGEWRKTWMTLPMSMGAADFVTTTVTGGLFSPPWVRIETRVSDNTNDWRGLSADAPPQKKKTADAPRPPALIPLQPLRARRLIRLEEDGA